MIGNYEGFGDENNSRATRQASPMGAQDQRTFVLTTANASCIFNA